MSVIVAMCRLPDARGGLKAGIGDSIIRMHENAYDWNKGLRKVGERGRRRNRNYILTATNPLRCAGALAQDFSARALIDGTGQFR